MRRFLPRAVFVVWLVVVVAALVAMARLWITREWRMYGGRSIAGQRAALFRHVGFPPYMLRDASTLSARLPADAAYAIAGDPVRLSYVGYLLIPRSPRPDAPLTLRDTGTSVEAVPDPGPVVPAADAPPFEHGPDVFAFGGSLAAVVGLALLLRAAAPSWSLPMGVAGSLLAGMAMVAVARGLSGSAGPGFAAWAAFGAVGWGVAAARRIRRRIAPAAASAIRPGAGQIGLAVLGGLAVLWSLLMAVVVVPDDWDAWAMWVAKAKVLALGAGPLADVALHGSPDYPLTWPALWAFTGWIAGGWEESWAKGWGAVLLALTALQIHRHVRAEHPSAPPAAATGMAAAFVTLPFAALAASWAYAEPVYWLALACAWSALAALRRIPSQGAAWTAGLMLAAAAYVKNEGIVFCALAAAWLFTQRGIDLRGKLTACLVPVLVYLPWALWTRGVLGLTTHTTGGYHGMAELPARISAALAPAGLHAGRIWADPRLWGLAGPVLGGLVIVSFVRGAREERRDAALIVLLALAYLGVILAGRNDAVWQVGVAWNRLTVHLLLLAVLTQAGRIARLARQAAGSHP